MNGYNSTKAGKTKISPNTTTLFQKETRKEEESSTCKEQEEVKDKQEVGNSAHLLTREGAACSCHAGRILPSGVFDKVKMNMSSCYEMEYKENEDEEKQEKSSKDDDKILTVLEAFTTCMDLRKIFN